MCNKTLIITDKKVKDHIKPTDNVSLLQYRRHLGRKLAHLELWNFNQVFWLISKKQLSGCHYADMIRELRKLTAVAKHAPITLITPPCVDINKLPKDYILEAEFQLPVDLKTVTVKRICAWQMEQISLHGHSETNTCNWENTTEHLNVLLGLARPQLTILEPAILEPVPQNVLDLMANDLSSEDLTSFGVDIPHPQAIQYNGGT